MQRNNKKGEHLNVTIGKKTNNTTNVYEFRYHKPKTLQNIQLKEKKTLSLQLQTMDRNFTSVAILSSILINDVTKFFYKN